MDPQTIEVVTPPSIDSLYYFNQIVDFFTSHYPNILSGTKSFIGILVGLSIPFSLILFIGIIYSVERLKVIRKREDEKFNVKVDMAYNDKKNNDNPELARMWEKVIAHISSQNPNDWKQAIIDADIILGDLLTKMGYGGEGIGEQLKRVIKGDFQTIDQAWEAHKIRNMVAHEGSSFTLDQHEAQRVINLYKQVFEEFYYI